MNLEEYLVKILLARRKQRKEIKENKENKENKEK